MINSVLNIKWIGQNLLTALFSVVMVFLPVFPRVATFTIMLIVPVSIFTGYKNLKNFSWIKEVKKPQFYLFLVFILYAIGISYSENLSFAGRDIEARLSFLAFPFLFMALQIGKQIEVKKLLLFFIIGCFLSSLLSVFNAVVCYETTENFSCWYSSDLAYGVHINYLSFYYAMAVIFSWYINIFKNKCLMLTIRIFITLWFFSLILLFDSMGMLLAIITMLLVLFFYFLVQMKDEKVKKWSILGSLSALVILVFISFQEVQQQYQSSFKNIHSKKELYSFAEKTKESISTRIVIWDLSWALIKANPYGVGTGDIKDKLDQKYLDNDLDNFAERHFNPHNQYFQTTIAIGWLGGIVLVFMGVFLFVYSYKRKNTLLLAFTVMAFVNMFFESFLERQAGIVFFSIMIFILDGYYCTPEVNKEKHITN